MQDPTRHSKARPARLVEKLPWLLPVIVGILAFFAIFRSFDLLLPTNIAWLDEGDPRTYYLGWAFFRSAAWSLPPGASPSYGLELASSIYHTDSIPLLAFVFKAFRDLLPQPFQYFGWLLLLNLVLQSVFAWRIVGRVREQTAFRLAGTILLVAAPILHWRLLDHFALTSHWLILAALDLSLRQNDQPKGRWWILLAALSVGINAYLLAMVLALWLADLLARGMEAGRSSSHLLREAFALLVLLPMGLWAYGFFELRAGFSSGGYGIYRMNVLSLFDSDGLTRFLPDLPGGPWDYEGFNYLGFGSLFLLAASCALLLYRREGIPTQIRSMLVPRFYPLLGLCVALTLFAISNQVGIGAWNIEVPLPDPILKMANLLRASGRLFWPVFYLITFALLAVVSLLVPLRTATAIVIVAAALQVTDLYPMWSAAAARSQRHAPASRWQTGLESSFWQTAAECYDKLRLHPTSNMTPGYEVVASLAANHGKATDAVYLARVDLGAILRLNDRVGRQIAEARLDEDTLYFVSDGSAIAALIADSDGSDQVARVDGYDVLLPKWRSCFGDELLQHALDLSAIVDRPGRLSIAPLETQSTVRFHLMEGWYGVERTHVWSASQIARLVVVPDRPIRDGETLLLGLRGFLTQEQPSVQITVRVGAAPPLDVTVDGWDEVVYIPLSDSSARSASGHDQLLIVEIQNESLRSPLEVGAGRDPRLLGVGLTGVQLLRD